MGKQRSPRELNELRKKAEKLLAEIGEKISGIPSEKDIQHPAHELSVYHIELEMQNDELRRAQEQLEESRSRYFDLYENAPVGYLTLDNKGVVSDMNLTAARLLGIKRTFLLNKPFAFLIAPESQNAFYLHIRDLLHSPGTRACELALRRGKGGERFFHAQLESIAVQANGTTAIRTVLTDIAERKRTEKALVRAKEEWERTFDSVPDMIAIIDNQYHILRANKAMTQRLGLEPEQCVGLHCYETMHGLSQPPEFCPHSKTLKDGRQHSAEVHEERLGGDFVISTTPLADEHGQMVGVVHVARDITERKQAEMDRERLLAELESRVQERTAELQRAYDRLKEETDERNRVEQQLLQTHKMEAIGTLAGGIAHDFNNMLAVVLGNAELALDDLDDRPGPKQNIKEIIRASKRSTELVRQILTFSRKTEQEKIPFNLIPLVKETYNLLRSSLPATIHMQLDIKTTSDTIIGDPSQVQQVLMNLCTNAAYAMRDKGSLLIELSSTAFDHADEMPEADMKAGNYVKLVVRDSGTGITEEVQKRMFEPFFTTKEAGHGTGMGLAVVYGIVKSHGGAISVESRPGEGSTFAILLPCAGSPVKEALEQAGVVPGGNERILFVDDEAAVVEMTCRALRRIGYDVTAASSGSEAFKTFLQEPGRFDLIITDQTMPDLTGIDLAKRMLAIRNDMPIILITGYSEAVSPEKAKEAGIREFLMKPVEKRELAETVRRALVGKVGTR